MDIVKVKLTDLIYADYNPRKALTPEDSEYQKIKRSIKEFGYVEPIIINQDKTIIGGHQRVTVLKDLGYEEAEAVIVDLDKGKEKALNVALNKISGEWDEEKLAAVLLEIEEIMDSTITGFDEEEAMKLLKEVDKLLAEQVEEDDFDTDKALEEIEEPITKPGDVWLLGNHVLMCGDATKKEDVKKLVSSRGGIA